MMAIIHLMMKIKYNLKKILLEEDDWDWQPTSVISSANAEEDELDMVDTSFFSKYDEMPDYLSPKWEEYHADMTDHAANILDRHLKDNPPPKLTSSYGQYHPVARGAGVHYGEFIDDFLSDFNNDDLSPKMVDHIKNSRAQTWVDMFDHWFANKIKGGPMKSNWAPEAGPKA